jgi:hypothetical protein
MKLIVIGSLVAISTALPVNLVPRDPQLLGDLIGGIGGLLGSTLGGVITLPISLAGGAAGGIANGAINGVLSGVNSALRPWRTVDYYTDPSAIGAFPTTDIMVDSSTV